MLHELCRIGKLMSGASNSLLEPAMLASIMPNAWCKVCILNVQDSAGEVREQERLGSKAAASLKPARGWQCSAGLLEIGSEHDM